VSAIQKEWETAKIGVKGEWGGVPAINLRGRKFSNKKTFLLHKGGEVGDRGQEKVAGDLDESYGGKEGQKVGKGRLFFGKKGC